MSALPSPLPIRDGTSKRDRGEKQKTGLEPGTDPVELLLVMPEASDQKRTAEHEQRIGDNGTGDRCLHQQVLTSLQGGECDDEFRQIAKRGVEQAADRLPGPVGNRLRRSAEEHCQGNDGADRQHEKHCVLLRPDTLADEDDRDEHQKPQQRGSSEFTENGVHFRSFVWSGSRCKWAEIAPEHLGLRASKSECVRRSAVFDMANPLPRSGIVKVSEGTPGALTSIKADGSMLR